MRRPGQTVTRQLGASVAPRPVPATAPMAALSSQPTTEFCQHHRVEAPQVDTQQFRPGWRVSTRLDRLLTAGRIDREAWEIARVWRGWAEQVGPLHAQRWDVRADAPCYPHDWPMLHRIQVTAKLRASADALGPLRMKLLEFCLVRDLSWRDIASRFQVSDKTATLWTAEAVNALADWKCGRPVAPPPELRFRHNGIGAR